MAARLATAAEVVLLVPQLQDLLTSDPETFAMWMDVASLLVGIRFGVRRSTAHALLSAHYLSQTQDVATPGGGGPVASEALGPASVSYATGGPPSDADLGASKYGQAFLALRNAVRGRGSAIVANAPAMALGTHRRYY